MRNLTFILISCTQVAIITGAASGIGKVLSTRLAQKGIKLVISDINEKDGTEFEIQLNQTYGKDAAFFWKCDVSSSTQLKTLFEKAAEIYGRIDVGFIVYVNF